MAGSDQIVALEQISQPKLGDQQEIIAILGEVLETREGETGLHVKRVAHVAALLAKLYGLTQDEIDIILTVTPLHDVGKVAIPDGILSKPGRLTDDEYRIVQSHSEIGQYILRSGQSELIRIASIIAHEHHERWDGSGYPCGKKGEDIHLYARIVAIADVFDALLSRRPYKHAWPAKQVQEFFCQQSGSHFDPRLSEVFIQHFDHFVALHSHIEAIDIPAQIIQYMHQSYL